MGCRTLEFYVNSGVGHWMSWGSTWRLVTIGKGTRKGKEIGQLGKGKRVSGKRKAPRGFLGAWRGLSGSIAR